MRTLGLILLCWCVATSSLAADAKVRKVRPAPHVSVKATDDPVLIQIRDWDAIGCLDPDQIFVIRMFRTTREVKATCE